MNSLSKIKNIIYIVLIIFSILVISYAMSHIIRQNREYEMLSRETINRQKTEEAIAKERANTEIELPKPKEDESENEIIETRPPLDGDVIMIF